MKQVLYENLVLELKKIAGSPRKKNGSRQTTFFKSLRELLKSGQEQTTNSGH